MWPSSVEYWWVTSVQSTSSYSLWILRFEPVEQGILVEGSRGSTVAAVALDVCDGVRVLHHLDEPHLVPSGQTAIWDHPVRRVTVLGCCEGSPYSNNCSYCTWDQGLLSSTDSPWDGSSGGSACLAVDLRQWEKKTQLCSFLLFMWTFCQLLSVKLSFSPDTCFVTHHLHSWIWCPPRPLESQGSYTAARVASFWSPWICTYLHCNSKFAKNLPICSIYVLFHNSAKTSKFFQQIQ